MELPLGILQSTSHAYARAAPARASAFASGSKSRQDGIAALARPSETPRPHRSLREQL